MDRDDDVVAVNNGGGDLVSETKIESLADKNKKVVVEDSDMNGVSTLLKLHDDVDEIGSEGVKIDKSEGISLLVDIHGAKDGVEKVRGLGEIENVSEAVDEFRRLAEKKLMCSFLPNEALDELKQTPANNAGIKDGVYVPEGRIPNLFVLEPRMFLSEIKDIAKTNCSGNLLDIAVIRSRLSAYYRWKGITFLDPQSILGLDHNFEKELESPDSNIQFPGPSVDDDDLLTPKSDSSKKGSALSAKRKKRSLADILNAELENKEDDNMLPKQVEASISESHGMKKTKDNEKSDSDDDVILKTLSRKVKETKPSGTPVTTQSKVENSETEAKKKTKKADMSSKKKKITDSIEVAVDHRELEKAESGEETDKPYSPRERKSSKYLSPPYVNVSLWEKMRKQAKPSKFPAESQPQNIPDETQPEKEVTRDDSTQENSPRKLVDEASSEMALNETLEGEAPAVEVLFRVRAAAVCPHFVNKNKSFDNVEGFLLNFRSSIFSDGTNYLQFDHEAGSSKKDDNQINSKSVEPKSRKRGIHTAGEGKGDSQVDTKSVGSKSRKRGIQNAGEGKDDNQVDAKSVGPKSRKRGIHQNAVEGKNTVPEVGNTEESNADQSKLKAKVTEESKPKRARKFKNSVPEVGNSKESNTDQSKLKETEESKPKKSRKVKKNDLMSDESKNLKNNDNTNSDGKKRRKTVIQESAGVKTSEKEIEGGIPSAILCVKFVPDSSLPTKNYLVGIYRKFGELDEEETNIYAVDFSARVVFLRAADAETALHSSQNASPFGAASLNFSLEPASESYELNKTESSSAATDLAYVKERLEMMAGILDNSKEQDPRLVSEMRSLLEKVSAMLK
ncbi:hypothetical protein ACFE04_010157 [Oxalis oulophora]